MDIVCVETSVVSFAAAAPGRDVQTAALQQQAREWWATERPRFDVVTSQLVIAEASAGDPKAAENRLKLLEGIPIVPINVAVERLAEKILAAHLIPEKASADALHIAAAAVAGVDYLLTLNCKHIANAHELPRVYRLLLREGHKLPLICTPSQFLGDDDDASDS